jgi:hypothetical protein
LANPELKVSSTLVLNPAPEWGLQRVENIRKVSEIGG